KIARFMGEKKRGLRSEQGHAYTREQIAEMLTVCDERTKAIILLLTSTGMRIGAIPALKFKHLKLMDLSLRCLNFRAGIAPILIPVDVNNNMMAFVLSSQTVSISAICSLVYA